MDIASIIIFFLAMAMAIQKDCFFQMVKAHVLLVCLIVGQYTLFQNGRHLNILLFLFKLALDASFLSLKLKRIFYLERGNKGQLVSA